MKDYQQNNIRGGLPPLYYYYNGNIEKAEKITIGNYYDVMINYEIAKQLLQKHGKYTDGIIITDNYKFGLRKLRTEKKALKYIKKVIGILSKKKIKVNINNMLSIVNMLLQANNYERIAERMTEGKDDENRYYYIGDNKIDKYMFYDWNTDGRYRALLEYMAITPDEFEKIGVLEYYDIVDTIQQVKMRELIQNINTGLLSSPYIDSKDRKRGIKDIQLGIRKIEDKHYNTKKENEYIEKITGRKMREVI